MGPGIARRRLLKRLVFCFDRTWNRLNAATPTNVVIVAQSVVSTTEAGPQIIHCDCGVGTGAEDRWRGGLLGEGLIDKLEDAYTFLALNDEPGDDLFVFGFSRGAFTARAFVGFVRNLGTIQRKNAARIADAVALYKGRKAGSGQDGEELLRFRWKYSPEICVDVKEDEWRVKHCPGYSTGDALVGRISYLGVRDTVGAMGVPSDLILSKWVNAGEQYFDTTLTQMVVSDRHAISTDERRTTFTPTLWPNVRALNEGLGVDPAASDAPYQQKWFPGDHGSAGGGGDVRGLSDNALVWVLDGAERMGLKMDANSGSPLFAAGPDPFVALANMTAGKPTLGSSIERALLRRAPRAGGPTALKDVSASALARWRASKEQLPEGTPYRPKPLDGVAAAIGAGASPPGPQHPGAPIGPTEQPKAATLYKVVFGDTVGALALKLYGHADRAKAIVEAKSRITDPDRIFVGQVIFLPIG